MGRGWAKKGPSLGGLVYHAIMHVTCNLHSIVIMHIFVACAVYVSYLVKKVFMLVDFWKPRCLCQTFYGPGIQEVSFMDQVRADSRTSRDYWLDRSERLLILSHCEYFYGMLILSIASFGVFICMHLSIILVP